jgi:uncharacterized protein (TIGR03067 family)
MMNKALLVALGALWMAATQAYAQEGAGREELIRKDKARLQGEWVVVKVGFDGKLQGAATTPEAEMTIVFDGNKIAFAQGGKSGTAESVTIDPTKGPKTIQIGSRRGIYEVDADRLTLLYFQDKNSEDSRRNVQPKKFETKAGDGLVLYECKRRKR